MYAFIYPIRASARYFQPTVMSINCVKRGDASVSGYVTRSRRQMFSMMRFHARVFGPPLHTECIHDLLEDIWRE